MRLSSLGMCAALVLMGAAASAHAQEGEDPTPGPTEPGGDVAPVPAPPPALPAPTLPDEPALEPPVPAPDPGAAPEPDPAILFRIHEDEEESVPHDVGFEVPGDLRTESASRGELPAAVLGPPPPPEDPRREGEEDEPASTPRPPPTFGVSVGAGWSRLLAVEVVDYARLEQRFEARVPDFESLKLGVGVAQLFSDNDRFLFEGGVRAGLGFFFCEASWVRCEGQVSVQPGVIVGGPFGVEFDLNAGLDLHFVIERIFQVTAAGAYSLIGTTSMIHLTGQVGLVF